MHQKLVLLYVMLDKISWFQKLNWFNRELDLNLEIRDKHGFRN